MAIHEDGKKHNVQCLDDTSPIINESEICMTNKDFSRTMKKNCERKILNNSHDKSTPKKCGSVVITKKKTEKNNKPIRVKSSVCLEKRLRKWKKYIFYNTLIQWRFSKRLESSRKKIVSTLLIFFSLLSCSHTRNIQSRILLTDAPKIIQKYSKFKSKNYSITFRRNFMRVQ
jgi:hypothetical protein